MTEASVEETPVRETLVRHGIYSHKGVFRIAVMDFTLQGLTDDVLYEVTPSEATLVDEPGSPEWIERMVRIRRNTVERMMSAESAVRQKINHFEGLADAILEKAVEQNWCEEYDAFAEEWGLHSRSKDYEVVMVIKVSARDSEAAINLVRDNVSIDKWSTEGIDEDPTYTAEEA